MVSREFMERVAVRRHREKQASVVAVKRRNVPAVGDIVIHHIRVATSGLPKECGERFIAQARGRGLIKNANVKIDRLDDKVVADGRIGIRR